MVVMQLTKKSTEADLEAAIVATIARVFPWIQSKDMRHQIKFSFTFGRTTIEVDGKNEYRKEGRADIIVYRGDAPLAVLELKRTGLALSSNDEAQGLSYARVLNPMAPIVIITNGDDARILATHTGQPLEGGLSDEADFTAVVSAAARAASADIRIAIQTLMGTTPTVWRQAAENVSRFTIDDLSATGDNPALPFEPGFLLDRKATASVIDLLSEGHRLVLVEGPPLIGKSNVLRELAEKTRGDERFAVLLLAAGGGGPMQALADSFANTLNWPVTREEARGWLLRMSQAETGPSLVLAIDGMGLDQADIQREITEMTSQAFGDKLQIVLSIDDSVVGTMATGANGRSSSGIGRRAKHVVVERLDDDEFGLALDKLASLRISFMLGAASARELRFPWVIRSMVSRILKNQVHEDPQSSVALAPLLSLALIAHARHRFTDAELRYQFQTIASAVLEDAQDQTRPVSLIVESLGVFIIRRKTLAAHMDASGIRELIAHGYLKPLTHEGGEPVVLVTLPELLASELAYVVATELMKLSRSNPENAAAWLAGAASNLPLGDIVCAQAVFDATQQQGEGTLNIIYALTQDAPTREALSPGSRFAMHTAETGHIDLTVQSDGRIVARGAGGRKIVFDAEASEELSSTYGNFHSWLILSHLAGVPFAGETEDGVQRIDAIILLIVGAADMALRQSSPESQFNEVLLHDVPGGGSIVCHLAGIVEPITYAMFRYLSYEGRKAGGWVDEVCRRKSLPLLVRAMIALQFLAEMGDEDAATFAQQTLDGQISAALAEFPTLHPPTD